MVIVNTCCTKRDAYMKSILALTLAAATIIVCALHNHRTHVSHLVKKPSIVIIVVASNDSITESIQISIDEKAAYARRHNYNFELTPQMNKSRHPAWSKLIQVSHLVPAYPDSWFWMLDTDTVITNPHVPVHRFLPSNTHPQVVIGHDCNIFNSGSFFIRSSKWSKWYAEYLLSLPEDEVQPLNWWEQSAIINTYKHTNISKYVWIAPIYWFNAYLEITNCAVGSGAAWRYWKQGDLLLHVPGQNPEKKVKLLKEYRSNVPTNYTESSISRQEIDSWWS